MIGQNILHYKILEKLGEGGMGLVYKAEDLKLERTVAIKFLPRHITAIADLRERFEIEARAAAALNHPNIATIYAIEEAKLAPAEEDDEMFIVMEYLEGCELREIVKAYPEAPIAISEALNYAQQIAGGLLAAHEKGIVHRDITSANLMLTENGQIKITDFGLAKLSDRSGVTLEGRTTMGTVAYMSPEQAAAKTVDHRTDIWSFGVVLYELLSGQLPFQSEYQQAVFYLILHKEPEPLKSLRPEVPLALANLVHQALAKNLEARYQSMQEMILDFKDMLNVNSASTHQPHDAIETLPKHAAMRKSRISLKGERRQVAIVVSALTGYGGLVENLAREDVNNIMKAIGSKAAEIVNKHEGLINQFSEDQIVLLFGVPVAHESDLSHAVRSALELHAFVRQLNENLNERIEEEIQVHSGIDAGLAIVQPRDATNRRFKLVGKPVQIAAKLAAEAKAGQILISSKSQRLLKPFFDTEAGGESFTLRGSAQLIRPFVIRGESGFRSRFEAIANATLTSFLGREKELEILRSALQQAINAEGQFVTVAAETGLGKSRLLYEFRKRLGGDIEVVQGNCQSYARNIPYFPFIALLRELLSIRPEDIIPNHVETVVSRIVALDQHLGIHIPLFLQLLSITSAKYPLPDHLRSNNIQQALVDGISAILKAAANPKPLVVLLEDWHWVDEASHDVLIQLAEMISSLPLCLVVSYRPEVAFEWGNSANHTQIQLSALEESYSTGMVKSVLGAESLPDDLAALIHERTEGNPFFIEELTQTLHEGGIIKIRKRKVFLADSRDKIDLPHTIQAVIRSRLDRLRPDSLEVLRVASVIGREFTASVLTNALTDQIEFYEALQTLCDLGLIRQTRVVPEATFQFKHILTQEVVYDSLLKHQRKTLHGLIGEILEERHDDRLGDHAALLMEHFSHAEHWEKAIHYGCQAADHLMEKSFPNVLNILEGVEQWIAKLPENQERKAILINVLLKLERTCESLGLLNRQKEIIDRLLTLIDSDDINRAEAYVRLGDLFILSNRFEEAENALNAAYRLSKALGHGETELRVLRSMGYLKVHSGRDEEAVAIIQKVVEMDIQKGRAVALVQDLNSLFTILMRLGDYDGAKRCLDDALALYDQVAPRHQIYINFMAGNYYRHLGDYDNAIGSFRTMVQIWEELGIGGKPTVGLVPLAHVYMIQGKMEEVLQCFEKAVHMSRKARIASELAIALYEMGKALLSFGRNTESLPHLQEAALVFRQLQDSRNETQVLCTLANVLEKAGIHHDALSTWEEVRKMGEQAGDLRIKLNAAKGMASATRHLADDSSHALTYYQDAHDLAQELEDLDEQGEILNTMGIMAWQSGHYELALHHYEKALDIFLEKDDKKHAGFILNSMASTLIKLNRHEQALARLDEAMPFHKQANQLLLEGHALALRGDLYLELQELHRAQQNYENSLELRQKIGDRKGEGWMWLQLAKVFAAQGLAAKSRACADSALTIAKECGDSNFLEEVQVYSS